jgi:serine/threonine-protein kinase
MAVDVSDPSLPTMHDAPNSVTEDSDARFKTGDVILGHYTVVSQLGRGGMGTVYLARDDVSGQEVAVKVLPASLARERDIRERFIQEARALASLDHPNIVPLVTFAQEGEDRFLVMKYLQGESLDTRLRRIRVLPPEHARKILRAVLGALGYAHSRGVIHRDVKPSNVLIEGDLDKEHRVFLVDFGIAKKDADGEDAHKLTQTGMLMGTPQYMSPEQISGHKVDGRSDIYAAGLVLFEMLAGRPPFDGQRTFQVLRAHVEQAVPDVKEARGGAIPEDLIALTYLLLRKDPNERPQNATEAIGLLDGTGSFPTLRPEVTPSTASVAPPAMPSWPPMAPTVADDSTGATKSVATLRADVNASLDDPSMEEILAVRPRGRGAIVAAILVLGAAAGTGLVLTKPWQHLDALSTTTPIVDSGSAEQSADKAAMMLLMQTAKSALKAKDSKAYDAIAAVVDKAPNDAEARSLQVDVCSAFDRLDEADLAMAALKKIVAAGGVEPAIVARIPDQEAELATKRSAPKPKPADTVPPAPAKPKIERSATGPSDSSVRAQAASTRAAVGSCYSELVQVKDPGAAGELTFAVHIAPAGRVDSVDLSKNTGGALFDSAPFKKCVEKQVKKWRFAPWRGEATTVPYQIQFSPR